MKYLATAFLLISPPVQAAIVNWDDDATMPNGDPEHRWHTKENWSGDGKPTASDDVKMLSGSLVELFTNSAEVSTIESTIPFKLGETLTITGSGTFENSITSGGLGRIRANGPVTFKGNNDLSSDTLEGSSFFRNQGSMVIGTRGIAIGTTFFNEGEFSLISGATTLGVFDNSGIFDFGGGQSVGSSTIFVNRGTLKKESTEVESQFLGDLTQVGETSNITVKAGAQLTIAGVVQEFKEGEIVADGTLVLTQISGGVPNRTFDGLSGISGDGTVNQVQEFELLESLTVSMPNAPGYEVGGLVFGRLTPTPKSASFTNAQYLTLNSSPNFVPADPTDGSSFFINTDGATIVQGASSNPSFAVPVENAGTWTTSGMKTLFFENTGDLFLEGDSRRIDPEAPSILGTLQNKGNGRVILGENGFARYSIYTSYNQEDGATTQLKNGLLAFEGGSSNFNGLFEIGSTERLNINRGVYFIEGSGLHFKAPEGSAGGTATIGGSQLSPELSVLSDSEGEFLSTRITNRLGIDGDGFIDDTKGFLMRSGMLSLSNSRLSNQGYMNWSGGTISGTQLENAFRLDISAGAPKTLDGVLLNSFFGTKTRQVSIIQSSSLKLADGDGDNPITGGRIVNGAIHRLRSTSPISGGGTNAYENLGLFIGENSGSAAISCAFENGRDGTVQATGTYILGFTNLKNLDENGVLTGGNWDIGPEAEILLPRDIKVMLNTKWNGPGARTVTSISKDSTLTKTTDEIHSVRLEVQGVVSLGAGTKTTIPEVELKDDGYLRGWGELVGDFLVGSGNVAPGESPGTLTITGNTTFTGDSNYEWESSASDNSDLLQINSGTATLAGTVRPVFLDGYVPSVETVFTILNAPSIVGTFDSVDLSGIPIGLSATLAYTATSVTLTVGAIQLPGYDNWKAENFTAEELADDLISGPNADPDLDGIVNFQEYVYGTNPKSPNAIPLKLSTAESSFVELSFPWAEGITDATFQAERGEDPQSFLPVEHTVLESVTSEGVTQYIIRVNTIESATSTFFRIGTLIGSPL